MERESATKKMRFAMRQKRLNARYHVTSTLTVEQLRIPRNCAFDKISKLAQTFICSIDIKPHYVLHVINVNHLFL